MLSRTAYICTQFRARPLSRSLALSLRPQSSIPTHQSLPISSSHRLSIPIHRTYASHNAPPQSPPTSEAVPTFDSDLGLRHARFGPQDRPWESIGLRPIVSDTLLRAFPNATRPTPVQKKLVTALTYGYSVACRGLPGTGKSFAIAAWLLGLERALKADTKKPTTSALVLVPNVDLAVHYHNMITTMLENSDSETVRENMSSFVQLLYRRGAEAELTQLELLRTSPNPHILIAPPTIMLDILADPDPKIRALIDVDNLRAIVIEEVDAAITQMVYYSRLKRDVAPPRRHRQVKQVPLQILLDYIIKCRLAAAAKRRVPPLQPQFVFPSATLSATQVKRFLVQHHREWLLAPELNMEATISTFSGNKPGEEWQRRARSNSLISVEEPPLAKDKVTPYVPDHIRHHVVAYDIRTKTLRDAPLPPLGSLSKEDIIEELNETKARMQDAIQDEDTPTDSLRVPGYPEATVIDIVGKLLEHDKYPSNVIVCLSPDSDFVSAKVAFRKAGYKCRFLTAVKWVDGDEPGKLPLGRTDMLLSASVRDKVLSEAVGGDKGKSTIWLTSSFYSRGIQTPGINHLYILHRIQRPREYITYSGRVASWPHARIDEEVRDPLSTGRDRRPTGHIVSVVLEDNVLEHAEKDKVPIRFPKRVGGPMVKSMVVVRDGSEVEKEVWSVEAVRLAKLGAGVEPYFVERDGNAEEEAETATSKKSEEEREPDILTRAMGLLQEFQDEIRGGKEEK